MRIVRNAKMKTKTNIKTLSKLPTLSTNTFATPTSGSGSGHASTVGLLSSPLAQYYLSQAGNPDRVFYVNYINSSMEHSQRIEVIQKIIDNLRDIDVIWALHDLAESYLRTANYIEALQTTDKFFDRKYLLSRKKRSDIVYRVRVLKAQIYFEMGYLDTAQKEFNNAIRSARKENKELFEGIKKTREYNNGYQTFKKKSRDPKIVSYFMIQNFDNISPVSLQRTLQKAFDMSLGNNGNKYFKVCIDKIMFNATSFDPLVPMYFVYLEYLNEKNSVFDRINKGTYRKTTTLEQAFDIYRYAMEDIGNKVYKWNEISVNVLEKKYVKKNPKFHIWNSSSNDDIFKKEIVKFLSRKYRATIRNLYNKNNWMERYGVLQGRMEPTIYPSYQYWLNKIFPIYLFYEKDGLKMLRKKENGTTKPKK